MNRGENKTVKDSIKSQEITRNNVLNVTANIDIQISRRGLEDTLNYASRHNDSATMDMLYHLNDIIKNSAYLDTKISEENNKNKAHNSVFMHNLYSIVKRDEKYYLAKIAVEEFIAEKDKTGLRFYNLQSIKIEPSRHLTFGEINQNRLALSVLNGSDISISQLRELVKTYDKNFYENEQAVGRPERLDEIAVDTAVSKAINEAQQAEEEKEMTGLFSIEQNGEVRYYKTDSMANDLLKTARSSQHAFIDLSEMGTRIS
ncbi:MAG: hypothetical protein K6B74_09190, partial [Ruminococcus sp.]|nr:hypothetical protein [Ruminococcus sp.]